MNLFNIARQFKQMKERNWSRLYWAIDLHDVVIPGKYSKFNEGREFYPGAKEILQWLSKRQDMALILWTSSHSESIWNIVEWFTNHNVIFNWINSNPECGNTDLCDFGKKFYFNILLDDKAGFVGETDWLLIKEELIRIGEW
jgi:hypothetical protein